MTCLVWQTWSTASFLLAQRRRWPVLLLIDTAWAPASEEAQRTLFARPDVQAAITDTCVPVRVDADRRPDIADRYGLGHWPTVLFLTPDGHVLTGGTRLDDQFASHVREIAGVFGQQERRLVPRPAPASPETSPHAPVLEDIAAALWLARDPRTGGFTREGRPDLAPALFALAHASVTSDARWSDAAVETVTALLESPRWSDGVLSLPGHAQPPVARLEDQAEWIRLLARCVRIDARASWTSALHAAVDGLFSHFSADAGHWRPWTEAPPLVLVDASARACRALLMAAEVCEHPPFAQRAVEALEALAPVAYSRGAGVYHAIDARTRGPVLLGDAMLLGHALLDADPWRDSTVYRDLAEEIFRTTVTRLQDGSGALRDRVTAAAGAGQVGRLADPLYPLDGNAEAVRLAVRLFGDDPAWHATAAGLAAQISREAVHAEEFAAPVGLAWHALGPSGSVMSLW